MTRAMKDRWITISLALVCSFGAVFVANWLSNKNLRAATVESRFQKIEQTKLDRSEFKEKMDQHELMQKEDKEEMKEYMRVQFDDVKELIKANHK